jgi:hypothetical protein
MPPPEDRALRIRELNRSVIEEFRASNGKVTHPRLKDADLVLLTTTGARTGQPRTTPLAYFSDGPGRIVLWASAMAAASHPAWYRGGAEGGRARAGRRKYLYLGGYDQVPGPVPPRTGMDPAAAAGPHQHRVSLIMRLLGGLRQVQVRDLLRLRLSSLHCGV